MTMRGNDRPSWDSARNTSARYIGALHDVSGRIPYEHVDWEAFYRRLAARADLALARHRHPHLVWLDRAESVIDQQPALAWWEHAARWSRAIVTVSVAAGIALIMVVRASPKETTEAVVATAIGVATDAPRAAFESAVVGRSSTLSMRATMLPSAADLLIPLGGGQGR
jgi:hypothetical protein